MKLNRKWILVMSLVLSVAIATGSTLAYMTATTEKVTNTFTLGNVSITLTEPAWGNNNDPHPLYPGTPVAKDPTITNTGRTNAWVWMTLKMPAEVYPYLEFQTIDTSAWIIDDDDVDTTGEVTLLYQSTLAPNGTATPFTAVELAEDADLDLESFDIEIIAYAIQDKPFEDVEEAYEAYIDDANSGNVGDNDDQTFTEPEGLVTVTNADELAAQVNAGATAIKLAKGTYHIPAACKGKTLTLVGEDLEETIIEIVPAGAGEGNGQLDYNFDGSTVTFQNLTIKSNNQTYAGFTRLTGTYKNVDFINHYSLQRDSVFEYCTLTVTGDQYNVWTWGAPNVTFDHCTFNSDGKALLLYGTANTNLTVSNCEFNDTGALPDLKAAIEIGNDYSKSYTLTVNNTKVNGYEENDKGIPTGSTLWANKNSMGSDNLNVVIDGVDVY